METEPMDEHKPENLLPAHSDVERHFFLMVKQCSQCGRGPFRLVSTEQTPDKRVDVWYVQCKSCQQGERLMFDHSALVIDEATNAGNELPEVNPTMNASKLIDAGQWLMLFHAILSAAANEEDQKESQRFGYEATLCLEEALKFYRPDNDLPPEEAIWIESSRKRMEEHPEFFLRQRLLQMREKLPSLEVMRKAMGEKKNHKKDHDGHSTERKHWWNRWFK